MMCVCVCVDKSEMDLLSTLSCRNVRKTLRSIHEILLVLLDVHRLPVCLFDVFERDSGRLAHWLHE